MTPFCQGPGRSVEDNWIVDSGGNRGVRKTRGEGVASRGPRRFSRVKSAPGCMRLTRTNEGVTRHTGGIKASACPRQSLCQSEGERRGKMALEWGNFWQTDKQPSALTAPERKMAHILLTSTPRPVSRHIKASTGRPLTCRRLTSNTKMTGRQAHSLPSTPPPAFLPTSPSTHLLVISVSRSAPWGH